MPSTIILHEALDSCHRFCFAYIAYMEVVIRAEKWPCGAACCSAVLLRDTDSAQLLNGHSTFEADG